MQDKWDEAKEGNKTNILGGIKCIITLKARTITMR